MTLSDLVPSAMKKDLARDFRVSPINTRLILKGNWNSDTAKAMREAAKARLKKAYTELGVLPDIAANAAENG